MDLIEVELARVVIQQKGEQQYIHLREKGGSGRTFPIVIGFHEVEEINRKLCGIQAPRPLTHDLVGRVLKELGWRLGRVIVTELRDGTFFANLVLMPADATTAQGPDERRVDCRPSDAIALAVQTGARMFVARSVFDTVAPGEASA
ncbi:MAG: bifunctional nuclease family protein [Planctomycetota bacterium]